MENTYIDEIRQIKRAVFLIMIYKVSKPEWVNQYVPVKGNALIRNPIRAFISCCKFFLIKQLIDQPKSIESTYASNEIHWIIGLF